MNISILNDHRNISAVLKFVFPLDEQSFNQYTSQNINESSQFLVFGIDQEEWNILAYELIVDYDLNDLWGEYLDYIIMNGEEPIAYSKSDLLCMYNRLIKFVDKKQMRSDLERNFYKFLIEFFQTIFKEEREYYCLIIEWH